MKKKVPVITAAASAAVLCAYRAYKGYGIFNKLRFTQLHKAVSRYIETHHPSAVYSSIAAVGGGYTTVITDNGCKYLLQITKTENGVFAFSETEI